MSKGFCILDPLFNKKICVLAGLALILVTALILLAESRRKPGESEAGSALVQGGSYEENYIRGYRAFQEQSGIYLPAEQYIPPAKTYSYTSREFGDDPRPEWERGYEDGYHRASQMQNCPGPY